MLKYKILFLVPVFESPECVEDLVCNIHSVCPNSGVLLHVNLDSSDEFYTNLKKIEREYEFCHIMPMRFSSAWCSGILMDAFIHMWEWSLANLNFEYFYHSASNSLLVNPELESKIDDFDCYYYQPWPLGENPGWKQVLEDERLMEYIKEKSCQVHVSTIEGLACRKSVIDVVLPEIARFKTESFVGYPAEEYVLPTVFVNVPHDFTHKTKNLEHWTFTRDMFIDGWNIPVETVQGYIYDIILQGNYSLLSSMYLHSLKRIARIYDDPYRKMLRDHFGYHNRIFLP